MKSLLNRKVVKYFFLPFLILYVLYFAFIIVFFNTRLFQWATQTKNPDKTNLSFSGAYSFYPGSLHAKKLHIHIIDPNVKFNIEAREVFGSFQLAPLFRKQFIFNRIDIKKGFAEFRLKNIEEKAEYQKKYTEPQDLNLDLKKKDVEENRKNNITLTFNGINVESMDYVELFNRKITGNFKLKGGFRLKPSVEVEVFPTQVTLDDGKFEDNLSNVQTKILFALSKFDVNEVFGNAVLKRMNIDLSVVAKAESLNLLNFIFRTMPGYELEKANTNIKTEIKIVNGELQKTSFFTTEATPLTLRNPRFKVTGIGKVQWRVLKNTDENSFGKSLFELNLNDIDVFYAFEDNPDTQKKVFGKIKNMAIQADLFGTNLEIVFQGVLGKLKIKDFSSSANFASNIPNLSPFKLEGTVTGEGEFRAISGKIGENDLKNWNNAEAKKQNNNFILRTKNFLIPSDKLGAISLDGSVDFVSNSFDFRSSTVLLPRVKTSFTFKSGRKKLTLKSAAQDVSYYFANPNHLKGNLQILIDDTKLAVEVIKSKTKLNNLLAQAASVRNLKLNLDWEIEEKHSWLRLNKVNSQGFWSGYGSLTNDGTKKDGIFELSVGPIPVGIHFSNQGVEYKILPSKTWYKNHH